MPYFPPSSGGSGEGSNLLTYFTNSLELFIIPGATPIMNFRVNSGKLVNEPNLGGLCVVYEVPDNFPLIPSTQTTAFSLSLLTSTGTSYETSDCLGMVGIFNGADLGKTANRVLALIPLAFINHEPLGEEYTNADVWINY